MRASWPTKYSAHPLAGSTPPCVADAQHRGHAGEAPLSTRGGGHAQPRNVPRAAILLLFTVPFVLLPSLVDSHVGPALVLANRVAPFSASVADGATNVQAKVEASFALQA